MKILRVNTKDKTFRTEDPGPYAGLGGRALTSRLVRREVPPSCHPLSADNKLVTASGLLTATPVASSGRVSVGGKSPLTGGIKEANSGGSFSQKLARLGYLALVLEDKPEDGAGFVNLVIDKNGARIEDAGDLTGLGTYAACDKIRARYGEKVAVMLVGPAGETCRLAASIQFTDPHGRPARAAGRGGLGAVMGSKRVKAIILDDAGAETPVLADKESFRKASKRWAEILGTHPVTSQGLPNYGTAILINVINEAGALPTKNFRQGRFDAAADVSGERVAELIQKRGGKVKEGCHAGCMIQCSQAYHDAGGKYVTSGFEYETIWALGPNCMIKDLDSIALMDHACDDVGLDTIETGNTLAVVMEAGIIPWGDGKAAVELVRRAGDPKDLLGKIIGNGAAFTGEAFGIDRVAVVKRQSLPAYDPRATKGIGVTYATTPMGADHTAGYAIAQNVLGVGGKVDPLSKEGQVELSKNLQIATAAIDATGFCLFVAFAVLDNADSVQVISDLLTARTGKTFSPDDFIALGKGILQDEFAFNADAGFTKIHDRLPDFFYKEPLPPHNLVWDFSEDELQAVKNL